MNINGRRDNYEGTQISKRKGRNDYKQSIQINGKRTQVYGKTKKDVRAKVKTLKAEAAAGVESTNDTVTEYLLRWAPDRDLEAKSIYARHLSRKRLEKAGIGDVKLHDLTAQMIKKAYDILRDTESLSDYSVMQVHRCLNKALKDAVREGTILANPIDRLAKKPTYKHVRKPALNHEERELVVTTTDVVSPKFTPLVTLKAIVGLRIGECLGLRWCDVDLDEGQLHVRQTLSRVPEAPEGKKFQFKAPKTRKSRRDIPIGPRVVNALRTQKLQVKMGPSHGGHASESCTCLVFANRNGRYIEPAVVNRVLKKVIDAAGIDKHITPHSLRRTAGTLMSEKKVSPDKIRDMLGHSTIQTTLDHYVVNDTDSLRETAVLAEATG